MKKRSVIELWRLVATIIILYHHVYKVSQSLDNAPFRTGWVYVEFFLILTGYFTMLHFSKQQGNNLDEVAKMSLSYTFRKFIRFLPYTTIPVVGAFFMRIILGQADYTDIQGTILELLFLRANIWGEHISNIPLWYLCTMFVVFPLFCCLCQIKARHFVYIIAGLISILYYGYTPALSNTIAPLSIIRTFSGLLLGVVVYGLSSYISENVVYCKHRKLLTAIELLCLWGTVLMSWFNVDMFYIYILLFVIGSAIMFTGISYTSEFKSPLLNGIGNFTLSLYSWQWIVGIGVAKVIMPTLRLSEKQGEWVYMLMTMVLAICSCWFVKFCGIFYAKKKSRKQVV